MPSHCRTLPSSVPRTGPTTRWCRYRDHSCLHRFRCPTTPRWRWSPGGPQDSFACMDTNPARSRHACLCARRRHHRDLAAPLSGITPGALAPATADAVATRSGGRRRTGAVGGVAAAAVGVRRPVRRAGCLRAQQSRLPGLGQIEVLRRLSRGDAAPGRCCWPSSASQAIFGTAARRAPSAPDLPRHPGRRSARQRHRQATGPASAALHRNTTVHRDDGR